MQLEKQEKQEDVKGDMTPMIDCVFLLLVFFMCAMKFKTLEEKLVTHLPKNLGEQNVEVQDVQPRLVELKVEDYTDIPDDKRQSGYRRIARTIKLMYGDAVIGTYDSVYLPGDPATRDQRKGERDSLMAELEMRLKNVVATQGDREDTPTIVKSDLRVPVDDVVQAMDAVIGAGVTHMSFSGHVAGLDKVRKEDGFSD